MLGNPASWMQPLSDRQYISVWLQYIEVIFSYDQIVNFNAVGIGKFKS